MAGRNLPEHGNSRAVLIGTWDYVHLDPVPAARHSLERMRALLTGPLCGWPADRVTVLPNPANRGVLDDTLVELFATTGSKDVALFYYVGHGQPDPRDQLCLGLVESRTEHNRRESTSLRFDAVRSAIADCGAGTKIVIVDCCFAGLAARPALSGATVLGMVGGTGAYTIAAAGSYQRAWYQTDTDDPQTYFTKYFADTVEAGVADAPDLLSLDVIFRTVAERLARDGKPVPTRTSSHDAGQFLFARNPSAVHSDTKNPDVWGDVPARNPHFTGRGDLLGAIHDKLTSRAAALLPHTLRGMGGVGKTHLAVEYAHRYASAYDLVWWVPAEQSSVLRKSLADLGRRIGVPAVQDADVSDTLKALADVLRSGRRHPRWLLVFDNADLPQDLVPFLSRPGGHVLITSRNAVWSGYATTIEVDVFARDESVAMLQHRVAGLAEADADRLAESLGDLPLAMEQAAGLMTSTAMSTDDYLELLEQRVGDILDEGVAAGHVTSVAVATRLSLGKLADQNVAAANLLELCAFFGAEPISIPLLANARYAEHLPGALAVTVEDPLAFRRSIGDIQRFGLARVDWRSHTIQVHRLVQALLRDRLPDEQRIAYRRNVQRILAAYSPSGDVTVDRSSWRRHSEIGPHLQASGALHSNDRGARAVVLDQISYLYAMGDYSSSRHLAQLAYDHWRGALGSEDPSTIVAARLLANVMRREGLWRQAQEINEAMLPVVERVLGVDHGHTLALVNSIGGDLRVAGKWRRSRALDVELLDRHRRVLGDDDPSTLRVANNFAVDLRLLGDFHGALLLDQDTWARRRRMLGDEHPDTLFSALTAVSRDLEGLGRYAEAIALQQRWLPVQDKQLHPDHDSRHLSARIHGGTLTKAGRFDDARPVLDGVAQRCARRHGDRHAETIAARLALCDALTGGGQAGQAVALGRQTLAACRRGFTQEHPFTCIAMAVVATALRATDAHLEARKLDESAFRSLCDQDEVGGADQPVAIRIGANLAHDLAIAQEHGGAVELLADILPRAQRVLGPDHPDTLAIAWNHALDLTAIGDERGERALRVHATTLLDRIGGDEDHPWSRTVKHEQRITCVIDIPSV